MSDLELESEDAFYDPDHNFTRLGPGTTSYLHIDTYKDTLTSEASFDLPQKADSGRSRFLVERPRVFKPLASKSSPITPRAGSRNHLSQHLYRVLGGALSDQRRGRLGESALSAQFRVDWELDLYIDEELDGDADAISEAITLTSEEAPDGEQYTAAYVCSDYIKRQWPVKGPLLLNAVRRAQKMRSGLKIREASAPDIESGNSNDRSGHLRMVTDGDYSIDLCPSADASEIFLVHGSFKDMFETAQLLCWMTAVFRPVSNSPVARSAVDFRSSTLNFCPTLEIYPHALSSMPDDSQESCWRSLFRNMPIASGFAIPPRYERHANYGNSQDSVTWNHVGIGLELPFQLMLYLAGVKYPLEIQGGIVFRGDRSLLVPTGMYGIIFQWHLYDAAGETSNITHILSTTDWYKTLDMSSLTTARTFLGYAGMVKINMGTKDSSLWKISRSHAFSESTGVHLNGLSMSFGSEGLGLFGAMLGGTFKLTKGLRANIQSSILSDGDRLHRSRRQPLLLFDDLECRGWLVPELSVVLLCLQSWASARGLDTKVPSVEASSDGGETALRAILEASGTILETQHNGNHVTIWDKVQLFLDMFQQRKEIGMLRRQEGPKILQRGGLLFAWEYNDIIDMKSFPQRKQIKFPTTLSTKGLWPKIFEDDPETLVLVCRGLGQLISPTAEAGLCPSCTHVPSDAYVLTASMECLQRMPALQQARGDVRLGGASQNPFLDCFETRFGLAERVQNMGSYQVQTDIERLSSQYPNGALILQGPRRPKFEKCRSHGTNQTLSRPDPPREDILLSDAPLAADPEPTSTETGTLDQHHGT